MTYRFLLDMDGIISDWHRAIAEHHRRPIAWMTPGKESPYEGFDIPRGKLWEGVDQAFWQSMNKTGEADKIVDAVLFRFQPHVCLTTLLPTNFEYPLDRIDSWIKGKTRWLKWHYPVLLQHFLFGTSREFCASERTILLDDMDSNVAAFKACGGNAILFPRPWNSNHHLIGKVHLIEWLKNELDKWK